MKSLTEKKLVLTNEERNLLSVAYKNVVGLERSAWRVISSIEQKEDDESRKSLQVTYKSQIEEDLRNICGDVLVSLLYVINLKGCGLLKIDPSPFSYNYPSHSFLCMSNFNPLLHY